MIVPHPAMSDELFAEVLEYNTSRTRTTQDADELMVRVYDEVSAAVLTMCETYHLTPQYVIEEFCIDGEFPIDPNQEY